MFNAVVVLFVGARTVLCRADNGIRKIGAAGDHRIDELADAIAVAESHLLGEGFLLLLVGVADHTQEGSDELGTSR